MAHVQQATIVQAIMASDQTIVLPTELTQTILTDPATVLQDTEPATGSPFVPGIIKTATHTITTITIIATAQVIITQPAVRVHSDPAPPVDSAEAAAVVYAVAAADAADIDITNHLSCD